MPITQPDLKFYHAAEVSELATNGGLMDNTNEAVTGEKNNLWPNASADDRTNGLVNWRKVFGSPSNDGNEGIIANKVWNHAPTPGDDYVLIHPGTKTDTQATFSATRVYGCGSLANDVVANDVVSVVTVENVAMTNIFADGDKVRFSNQDSPELAGDFELVLLTAAPSINGLDITLTHEALVGTYLASNTVVASLYQPGDKVSGVGTIVISSASGTVDESGFPPVTNNRGTVDEELTFSFSSGSNFTVAGSRSGPLEAGSVNADYTAINPNNLKNIITLPNGFFTGTYVGLDTVVIPTIANNFAFWLQKTIPPLSSKLNSDLNITAYTSES